ncbi:MAG: branched-chain amino acid ABC transporter permease [Gammaproteobacteria bacterium]
MKPSKLALPALFALAVFMVALPFGLKLHQQDFMISLLVWILVVSSYRLMALTGEYSLVHVVLMGAGAYGSALLAKLAGFSVWLAMPCGALVAAGLAAALSFPLFRMSGFYFLIGSFAAGEAIRLSWTYFTVPFGGPKGIKLIPSPELTLPGVGPIAFYEPIPYYYLTLIIVSISLYILYRLENSRIGLTMNAIHWRAPLAESVGVDTWRYRALAFVIASFFAGLAGALFCHYYGTANPSQFDVAAMVYVLIWVIVGGVSRFSGPIVGVVVLSVLNELFREAEQWRPLIYGCILIAAMFYLPDGLIGLPGRIRGWLDARRGAGAMVPGDGSEKPADFASSKQR